MFLFLLTHLDVPPLEDMSELINQVNKLREDVSSGQSSDQSTKTSSTKPKIKSESSAEVIFPYHMRKLITNLHKLSLYVW